MLEQITAIVDRYVDADFPSVRTALISELNDLLNTRSSDASGYVRGLEDAAKVAGEWSKYPSCTAHEDHPCCHKRTAKSIEDKIVALQSIHQR